MRTIEECVYYLILLIIIVLFFYMVYPALQSKVQTEQFGDVYGFAGENVATTAYNLEDKYAKSNPDDAFLLSEGENKEWLLPNTRCSKSCCGQQWRVPHKLEYDPIVCQNRDDYVPTNFTCSNQYTSGCACIPRRLRNYLTDHAGNQ